MSLNEIYYKKVGDFCRPNQKIGAFFMPISNHLERRVTQLFSILSFIKRQALYPDFKKNG